jgi:Ca2+-binding RTX toxin-like protein
MREIRLSTVARPMAAFAIVLGAALGMFGGFAFSATINCSHVNAFCQGTEGGDQIYGWDNQNHINARGGYDQVWAYPGSDEVSGEDAADAINGGENNDYLLGNFGNDNYWIAGGGTGLFGGGGPDNLYGGVGEDFLEGNASGDLMYGNDHSDVFYAEDGQGDGVDGNGATPGKAQPCYVDGYDSFTNCTPY